MKVLLATDGSKYADEAAWLMAHLPHHERLELTVLTVVYVPEVHGTVETKEWMARRAETEKADAGRVYSRVAEMFAGANADIEHALVEGHAARTIIEEAEGRGVDLIVLGARGHSVLDRMLLGSVSDFVATHAHCSVLVVRPTGLRDASHRTLKLTLACDVAESENTASGQLRDFGWGRNTQIDVVTVVSFVQFYSSEVPIAIDTGPIKENLSRSVEAIAESLHDLTPNTRAFVCEADHIGDGITRFAEERGSDIIVMGDTTRGTLGRFLLGSVSRYVLRHSTRSVWIVRNPAGS